MRLRIFWVAGLVATAACGADSGQARLKATTKASYDPNTGKLQQITYDANRNGTIDTWTYMDGTRILRAEVDTDEDGKVDRWEIYGENNTLEKVGFSRAKDGKADAWAFQDAAGRVQRIEISTKRDGKIDRQEWYDGDALVRAEEDSNGDGRVDRWETFAGGALATVAFDENADGAPDRRLTYERGALAWIESEPDARGRFALRIAAPR